jgi:hypothetical protein
MSADETLDGGPASDESPGGGADRSGADSGGADGGDGHGTAGTNGGTADTAGGDNASEAPAKAAEGLEDDRSGSASDRYRSVRDAQQRIAGDSVSGDKIVVHLSSGQTTTLRPLSPTLEEVARLAFVEPDGWTGCRLDFRDRRTVLLRGTAGQGRSTMAIRLLQTVETTVIYNLDPHIDLEKMAEQLTHGRMTRGAGFLLCLPEKSAQLNAYLFNSLEAALKAADARLVITMAQDSPLGDNGLHQYEMNLPSAPPLREILRRHLGHWLDDEARAAVTLADPDVAGLIAETLDREGTTCQVTADLARIVSRAGDPVDALKIKSMLLRRHADEFDTWFDNLDDLELWSFAIALAVLDGLPLEDVADAASRLRERLSNGGAVVLAPDRTLRVDDLHHNPFRTSPGQLWRMLQARVIDTKVRTDTGYVPATTVSYSDSSYSARIVARAWKGYRIQGHLLGWLGELVVASSEQVRVRAGVAVGVLATFGFDYVRRRLLLGWAASGTPQRHEAVADVLQVASRSAALRPAIDAFVEALYRSGVVGARCTAALALGNRLGHADFAAPVRSLERLIAVDDQDVRRSVGMAFANLLVQEGETITPVLYDVLQRGLLDSRRVAGAQLIFLRVAKTVTTEVPGDQGDPIRWPTLLLLAQEYDHLRRPLSLLWARMLAGGDYIYYAETVLRSWASDAESDPSVRRAFARLVRAVADVDRWAGSAIERQARKWGDEDGLTPMPKVAAATQSVLVHERIER